MGVLDSTFILSRSCSGTGTSWTLLDKLSTTEFLNYEGGKFSKSLGRGVFGDHAIDSGIPSEVGRLRCCTLASRKCHSNMWITDRCGAITCSRFDRKARMQISTGRTLPVVRPCGWNCLTAQLHLCFIPPSLPLVPSSDRNNGELLSNLGNFVNRSLKFTYDRFDRRIPGLGAPSTQAENELVKSVSACVSVALMLVPCMGSLLQIVLVGY